MPRTLNIITHRYMSVHDLWKWKVLQAVVELNLKIALISAPIHLWHPCHIGHIFIKKSFNLFCFLSVSDSTIRKKVSLSWKSDEDHLILVCRVTHLSFGVSFEDPHGKSRGHCTAAIRNLTNGTCDSHLTQNILTQTTTLTIDRVPSVNGLWKCYHGENTNECATVSVSLSVNSTEQTQKGKLYIWYIWLKKYISNLVHVSKKEMSICM